MIIEERNHMNKSLGKSLEATAKLLKIARTILIAGLIFIAILFAFSLSGNFMGAAAASINSIYLGKIELFIKPGLAIDSAVLAKMMPISFVFAAALIGIILYGVILLEEIIKTSLSSSPFSSAVSRNLSRISLLIIAYGVLTMGVEFYTSLMIGKGYNFALLFNSSAIDGYNIKTSFDLSFVIFAAMFYLLSKVFKYGEELQTLSDETL